MLRINIYALLLIIALCAAFGIWQGILIYFVFLIVLEVLGKVLD